MDHSRSFLLSMGNGPFSQGLRCLGCYQHLQREEQKHCFEAVLRHPQKSPGYIFWPKLDSFFLILRFWCFWHSSLDDVIYVYIRNVCVKSRWFDDVMGWEAMGTDVLVDPTTVLLIPHWSKLSIPDWLSQEFRNFGITNSSASSTLPKTKKSPWK